MNGIHYTKSESDLYLLSRYLCLKQAFKTCFLVQNNILNLLFCIQNLVLVYERLEIPPSTHELKLTCSIISYPTNLI